jgi:hypothetical protein
VLVAAVLALLAAAASPGRWKAHRALPFGAALAAAGALVWLVGLAPN